MTKIKNQLQYQKSTSNSIVMKKSEIQVLLKLLTSIF